MHIALRSFLSTFKWLSLFLLGLILIVPICFYLFFDPNDFKPQISAMLSEKTGLPLTINGKMEFSFLPWLGIKVNQVNLEQLITIKEIDLKIPLHDLLEKRIIVETMEIKGLNVNLIKQADGQTNWNTHVSRIQKPTSSSTVASEPISSKKTITFLLKQIDIKDFTLHYTNNQNKQTWVAEHGAFTGRYNHAKQAGFEGDLSIDSVTLNNYRLEHVTATIKKEGALLTAKSLKAKLFNASLTADITHTVTSQATSLQGTLTQLALQPLLQALNKPEVLSGNANIDFNLTQQGTSPLNGVIKCNVTNGVLQRIDINYYLSLARALLKKENSSVQNTKQTPFQSLNATFLLHNNLMDNNDLVVLGENFQANAEGTINLSAQTLAYKLNATKRYTDGKEHPNTYPLAIRIKGPLNNPSITPDMDVYMKKLLTEHFNTDNSQEDLKQKIKKEASRGLKKLLKLP